MNYSRIALIPIFLLLIACQGSQTDEQLIFESLERLPSASLGGDLNYFLGNEQILISGNKKGSFSGEEGISLKSINLLSGYSASIKSDEISFCLNNGQSFIKYPFATSQIFKNAELGIEVKKLEFIAKNKDGLPLLYSIKNVDNSSRNLKFIFQPYSDLKPRALMDSTFGTNTPDQINYDELTGLFTAKDQENDWFAMWGTAAGYQLKSTNSECAFTLDSLGASAGFEISLELAAGEEKVIPVFIAGSDKSELDAMETLADLRLDLFMDWNENFALIDSLRKTAQITIPDQKLQAAYDWSKYKVGLFQFNENDVTASGIQDPDQLHQVLNELSKEFTAQVDVEQFSFDKNQPRHIAPSWELIQPTMLLLMGIHGDVANRVTYIRPNLPKDWTDISVKNLWIEDNMLTISIRSNENQMIIEVTQTQKKAGISIELPESYSKVKMLGKEVSNDTKDGFRRILMTGDHVKIEAKK